jgi:diacylglycerol kinase (ATP)
MIKDIVLINFSQRRNAFNGCFAKEMFVYTKIMDKICFDNPSLKAMPNTEAALASVVTQPLCGGMLKVGVLSNPLSGANRKGLGPVEKVLAEYSQVLHHKVQTSADMRLALNRFAEQQVDILAVNGGDGTVHAVLTDLFNHSPFASLPLLALLPGGTANMLAKDLGLKGSLEKAMRRLLGWASSGTADSVVEQRPVLQVQAPGFSEPLFGLFFGLGIIYQAIRFFHDRVKTWGLRGRTAQALIVGRYLLALAAKNKDVVGPVHMDIGLDGKRVDGQQCLLVLISTLEKLILGLRPYWGCEEGPLRFTALNAHPRHLLRTILGLVCGRNSRHPGTEHGYLSHNASEIELVFRGGFTLDGELYMPAAGCGPVVLQEGGQASFLRL